VVAAIRKHAQVLESLREEVVLEAHSAAEVIQIGSPLQSTAKRA